LLAFIVCVLRSFLLFDYFTIIAVLFVVYVVVCGFGCFGVLVVILVGCLFVRLFVAEIG